MTFDRTQPTNSTKIRNYPTVIPNNFSAIEKGDISLKHWQVNFIERNAVPGGPPPANDPTRADDTMIVFSKQDASAETELFIMDDRSTANVIQVTEDGKLGSSATDGVFSTLTIGSNSTVVDDNQYIIAWGKFNSSGVFQYGVNMATSGTPHPSSGLFNVDVSADKLITNDYMVTGNVSEAGNSSGSIRGLMPLLTPLPVASTVTTIQVEIKRDGGRTNNFDYFFVQVVGGQ